MTISKLPPKATARAAEPRQNLTRGTKPAFGVAGAFHEARLTEAFIASSSKTCRTAFPDFLDRPYQALYSAGDHGVRIIRVF